MSRRWRSLAAVGLAVLAVLVLAACAPPDYAEPIEVVWAVMGAGGSVFAFQITRRRWQVNAWRKREAINGLFAISAHGSAVLRTSGLVAEVLILLGGLSAMATPPSIRPELRANDVLTTLTILGIGICLTFSAWYADRQADRQAEYVRQHPEA